MDGSKGGSLKWSKRPVTIHPRDLYFITRKARTIKNYHFWLEKEFGKTISLPALRRCAKRENLKFYLEKEDFDEDIPVKSTFRPEPVFGLIQVDGCIFRYFKIRNDYGNWQKPQVIETFDTGSRYMFDLDAYFDESNLSSLDLFNQFLLDTPFPHQEIRFRPDCAKGFVNLKRPINALNIKYSTPGGFYLKSDFSRPHSPRGQGSS